MKERGQPRGERQTAEDRREAVLEVARVEFGARGLYGASTEQIAKQADISHSYLFKLFNTKKDLFLILTERTYDEIDSLVREGAQEQPDDPLAGITKRVESLLKRRSTLLMLLQGFAASVDRDVAHAVQRRWDQVGCLVEELCGMEGAPMDDFWGRMMLWIVGSAIYQDAPDNAEH